MEHCSADDVDSAQTRKSVTLVRGIVAEPYVDIMFVDGMEVALEDLR